MKQIIVGGRNRYYVKRFQCKYCGCIFDSDEWNASFKGTVVFLYDDICPSCGETCTLYEEDEEE